MQGAIEKRGSIGIVWIDNPPVNAISQAVRKGLIAAVETAASDDEIEALVLACRGRTFMAGADITEFGGGPKPPGLGEVIEALSESPKIIGNSRSNCDSPALPASASASGGVD